MSVPPREPGLYFRTALLPGGWAEGVRIQTAAGRISVVERGVEPLPGDERASVGLPGVPNVHSHAFQRGMAGLAERRHSSASASGAGAPESDSFWSWRDVMYRFVQRLEPEDLEAIAAQAFVEMLESGFTRVCEFHYVHHDAKGRPYADLAEMGARVAAAAASCGIALTLLPVFYAHGGFGGRDVGVRQARFANDVERFGRLVEASRGAVAGLADAGLADAVVGIAPHSLRAVTPDELRAILPLAAGGPIHIHVAEQRREVEECLAHLGARPVQWLTAEMPVDGQWCFVHATHVTDEEIGAVARSGVVAGLCPITEANLGDGVFPAEQFQAAGGRYGIGSDSNVLISVSEELRVLEYGQRLRDGARNVLARGAGASTGRTLFEKIVRGGAQAAGVRAAVNAAGAAAASAKVGGGNADVWAGGGTNVSAKAVGGSADVRARSAKASMQAGGDADLRAGGAKASAQAAGADAHALTAGAAANNLPAGAVAGLAVGAPADIVSLNDDVALAARSGDAILDSFIFATPRNVIDGVWRGGRKVVSGGVHIHRAPIAARFRATLQRLLAT